MVAALRTVGMLFGPLREQLVAHLPQLREEQMLETFGEQLRRFALERRRARADLPVDQRQMSLPPGDQILVEVEQRLAQIVELGVRVRLLVDLPKGQLPLLEELVEHRRDLVGEL